MASRRVIFMGTPEISSIYLQSLIDSNQNIIAVFTQPPRKKGRGMKIQQSPVHKLAEDNSISVFTPTDLNLNICLLYTSPSPRDLSTSRMPSSA